MDTAELKLSASRLQQTQSLALSFKDLYYTVPITDSKTEKSKTILNGVSGLFRPGRLTIILGSSGAGKTSLLNVISGQAKAGACQGDLRLNGFPVTGDDVRKMSGFVFQEDVVLDTQTVREAIEMSALLRIPDTEASDKEKLERVDDVISLMQLQKASNTYMGSALVKGVSGGEKKRTLIAMSIITNPGILFLDEPTSGLDTYNAYSVVRTLRRLARSGRTVITTLHQPSSDIFHLSDDTVLMSEGKIVYFGPTKHMVDYFGGLGYQCPKYTNPCDYVFMNVLNDPNWIPNEDNDVVTDRLLQDGNDDDDDDMDEQELQELFGARKATVARSVEPSTRANLQVVEETALKQSKTIQDMERMTSLTSSWVTSKLGLRLVQNIDKITSQASRHPDAENYGLQIKSARTFRAGSWKQFRLLMMRAWRNSLRNKMVVLVKFFQVIAVGLLVDLIFNGIPNREAKAQTQDRAGVIFFIVTNMIFTYSMGNLAMFAAERAVFEREHQSRLYGLPAYFLSKTLIELPFLILIPTLLAVLYYFCVGLQRTAEKFFLHLVTLIVLANCGNSIGLWGAATFSQLTTALAVMPLLLLPFMVFAGIFVNLETLPVWIRWLQWLSPMKYGYVALMSIEFDGLTLPCSFGAPGCTQTGAQVLDQLGLANQGSVLVNILALVGFWIGLWVLAYVGFMRVVRNSKGSFKMIGVTKTETNV